jgi:predicted nucleic acid-binding protein
VIVVADTSVFLNLGHIGQAELLHRLYSKVVAPPVVWERVFRPADELA